ncbi:MAG: methyltransferase domain-containing protein, partial [Deltaproteobacteria bacterium]|nr:methyltransferase domain-containing protein [Deltaproteobacteria bacterium]
DAGPARPDGEPPAPGGDEATVPSLADDLPAPPGNTEDEETILDEKDQLPLTPEEMAEVQGPGAPPSWLEEEIDDSPLFAEEEPAGTAPSEAAACSVPGRSTPPPPPPQALLALAPEGRRSVAPQQQAAPTEEAPSGEEHGPPPWYTRMFSHGYLELMRHRSPRRVRHQVEFLLELLDLPSGAHLLDLACGDGAHAIQLAQHGYQVTGLDLSEAMIGEAQRQAEAAGVQNAHFVRLDMRGLSSEERFDAVISLETSFGYFDDQTNFKVLKSIAAAIRPGGRLLIELLNRDFVLSDQPLRRWHQSGPILVMEEGRFDYVGSQLIIQRTVAYPDGRQQEDEIRLRLYSLHELNVLMRVMGLEVLETLGSAYRRHPFLGRTCRQIVLLAQKQ